MAYVKCNVGACVARDDQKHMTRVEVVFDGAPLVGYACTTDHADRLRRQWATGDRYSPPVDEIWATVGGGQVAAA